MTLDQLIFAKIFRNFSLFQNAFSKNNNIYFLSL